MQYNLIGLDPSIISTGMVINGKVFNYCRFTDSANAVYGKSGKRDKMSKWFDMCKDVVTYREIVLNYVDGYSENEVQKLKLYDAITDMIIADIKDNLIEGVPTLAAIEGFSYSSAAGDLIDLVTFSTLVRRKLLTICDEMTVLAPSTLKLETCRMTYQPIDVGKKKVILEYRNKNGIAGGSFSKVDMCNALIENDNLNDSYCKMLKDNSMSILFLKDIKKPLEDCNDAYLLYQYLVRKTLVIPVRGETNE